MNQRAFMVVETGIVAVILLILATIWFVRYSAPVPVSPSQETPHQSPTPTLTSIITSAPIQEAQTLDFPENYQSASWTVNNVDELSFQLNCFDTKSQKIVDCNSPKKGEKMSTTIPNIPSIEEARDKIDKIGEYYVSELTKQGWNHYLSFNDVDVSLPNGDGPAATAWGMLGYKEHTVRSAFFSQSIEGISWNEETLEPICPCTVKVDIELSEKAPFSLPPISMNKFPQTFSAR
ncbi:hypothetical protein HGA91_01610 [candidate division WWE3 bacterium]|nr:hypothetical protein [candidate division WWE3 bacterium]